MKWDVLSETRERFLAQETCNGFLLFFPGSQFPAINESSRDSVSQTVRHASGQRLLASHPRRVKYPTATWSTFKVQQNPRYSSSADWLREALFIWTCKALNKSIYQHLRRRLRRFLHIPRASKPLLPTGVFKINRMPTLPDRLAGRKTGLRGFKIWINSSLFAHEI